MNPAQVQFVNPIGIGSPTFFVQIAVLAALVIGTIVRLFSIRLKAQEAAIRSISSLATWWVIVLTIGVATLAGRIGCVLIFAVASGFAMSEFQRMTKIASRRWVVNVMIYTIIAINYLLVYLAWIEAFLVFTPLASFVLVTFRLMTRNTVEKDLLISSAMHWGFLLTTYCLSFAPLLLTLSESSNPIVGPVGWFLYLLILTAVSDIVAALVGRPFGKHKLAPLLSPNKSWEGLVAGTAATIVVAVLLSDLLTPLNSLRLVSGESAFGVTWLAAIFAGLLVSTVGFFGDLTISAVKRDLGVKDSGNLLPGQGGILDRIDSLMYTAPAFYVFVISLGYR